MPSPSAPAAAPALEVRQVSKVFGGGVAALDGASLTVERGETVVIVGESGSGKTTLLRLFNRLEVATSGEVLLGGEPVEASDPIALRRRVGYVQQEGGLLPHWTVERNVALVPELLGWGVERRRARTDELLELVGLPAATYGPRYPRQISGGQRQRVAFARAIAADPDVVLLDEPFGALDAITRFELQNEFLALKGRLGKTFLLVTHDLGEAFRLGDRIAVMRSGRVLQVARGDELERSPADGYVERLLEITSGAVAGARAAREGAPS
ncbi:MAG TPA: ATP-binding cassette domain-containing protein [Thermoanaerobaculia bacterium]|nr:ATP-binding cassette domain-containing protein [Thermoanaerobaculia bacterium]